MKRRHSKAAFAIVPLVLVILIGVLSTQTFGFPSCPFCKRGRLSYGDEVDVWGICSPCGVSREHTSYISEHMYQWIKIRVNPDWALDVAVGLFILVPGREPKLLKPVDNRGKGGTEYLSYYVSPSHFSMAEHLSGYFLIGVFRVSGVGEYRICVDCY